MRFEPDLFKLIFYPYNSCILSLIHILNVQLWSFLDFMGELWLTEGTKIEGLSMYKTIKDLIFHLVRETEGRIGFDELTRQVMTHFPTSKWNRSHWSYYKSHMRSGRWAHEFPDSVKLNLVNDPRGRQTLDPWVMKYGNAILGRVRRDIASYSDGDETKSFRLNRMVFTRLHHDELRIKREIKRDLWRTGDQRCVVCKKKFRTMKEMDLHRHDAGREYSSSNAELVCRECHLKIEGSKQ